MAEVGVLFERDANRGGGGLRSGVELPGFNGVHGGIDEQGVATDRFDGDDFSGGRDFDFQLDRALEVHATGSLGKAGADVVVNVA